MSIINLVKDHYGAIPPWMIRMMGSVYYCLPESRRYGNDYSDTWRMLKETESLPKHKADEMANRLFAETVQHAYEHVPFYRKHYDAYGVDMRQIQDLRDITKLPTISKEDIRQYAQEMMADDVSASSLMRITTSGSTGSPVGFYQPKTMLMTEWAYTMHIWGRVGCTVNSSRLVLRGKKFHSSGPDPDIFYDPLRRELSCNIFNMTEETMERYCAAIEKYKPEFIHGYMSAVVMLAKYIASRPCGLRHHFKAVLATSETVHPQQKDYVEQVLGTRVFSFYGHSERTVIAGECEKSSEYHVEPMYGYCEILDEQGNPNREGEIVGTGFQNPAMPLIRYRTGDQAGWSTIDSCGCGRSHMRLTGVQGRIRDMIVNRNGTHIPLAAVNIHSENYDKILKYQFVQDNPGFVTVRVLPGAGFASEDAEKIENILTQRVNGTIRFQVEVVDVIPVGKNGKHRMVEQNIRLQ